jgi:hypothetical protein
MKSSGLVAFCMKFDIGGQWNVFDKDPRSEQRHEEEVFSPMPDIFNAIVRAIIANLDLQT